VKEIRITPQAQLVGLLVVGGLLAAAAAAQLPEAKRYWKIETM
jgi:hypothetical protein